MSLAVISMSFVFPALGLVDSGTSESEIPQFSMNQNRFDIAGDFPESSGTPTTGELWWNGTEGGSFSDNQIWLEGDTSNGVELVLDPNHNIAEDSKVEISEWSDGTVTNGENFTFNGTGKKAHLSDFNYSLRFHVVEYRNDSNGDLHTTVDYEISEQPNTDGGWIGRLPIIGTAYSATETLGATVAWLGSILFWFFGTLFEVTLNVAGMLYDATSYLIATASWLIDTYSSVITGAKSWASVFVAIPGIILSLVLTKIAVIGISLLPTT